MSEAWAIGLVVVGLTGVLGLAVAWRRFMGASEPRTIGPQPLVVKQAEEWASQRDLDALRIELAARIEQHERRNESDMALIRGDLRELREHDVRMQSKIDNLTRATYAVAGKMGVSVSHE